MTFDLPGKNSGAALKRVLVVDDDPIHIELARELLSSTLAAQVATASDGKSAKVLVRDYGPFDLIFLDLIMPEFDGVEFLEHLRDTRFRGAIVIVSGADKNHRTAATCLGAAYGLRIAGTISKPLTITNLAPALAHA